MMKGKKKLLDADAFLDKFEWKENSPLYIRGIRAMIESAPAIDAVPVVRCKDCKYNLNNDRLFADPDPILTYAWCNTEAFQENDFCSKGKRKEE